MKLHPSMLFILLWTICLYLTGSQAASDRDRGMTIINKGRRDMADKLNIKNMNDLSWSDDLGKKAKKLSCGAGHGSDYRVFLQPDNEDKVTVQVEEELLKYVTGEDLNQLIAADNLFIFEVFVPQQKYIGCAPKQCTAQFPMPSGEIKQLLFSVLCVMGPHGSLGDLQIAIPDDASAGNSEKKVAKSVQEVEISGNDDSRSANDDAKSGSSEKSDTGSKHDVTSSGNDDSRPRLPDSDSLNNKLISGDSDPNRGTTGATNGWSNWNLHLIFTISLIISCF